MVLVSLFEQPERLVFVAESRINRRNFIEIDISVRGQVPEFLGDLQRISPPARDGINPTKADSNELVLCCYSLVLIGNFGQYLSGGHLRYGTSQKALTKIVKGRCIVHPAELCLSLRKQ